MTTYTPLAVPKGYIRANAASKTYGVDYRVVEKWADENKIRCRFVGKARVYNGEDIARCIRNIEAERERKRQMQREAERKNDVLIVFAPLAYTFAQKDIAQAREVARDYARETKKPCIIHRRRDWNGRPIDTPHETIPAPVEVTQ